MSGVGVASDASDAVTVVSFWDRQVRRQRTLTTHNARSRRFQPYILKGFPVALLRPAIPRVYRDHNRKLVRDLNLATRDGQGRGNVQDDTLVSDGAHRPLQVWLVGHVISEGRVVQVKLVRISKDGGRKEEAQGQRGRGASCVADGFGHGMQVRGEGKVEALEG